MADEGAARDELLEEVFREHRTRMVGYAYAQLRVWNIPPCWVDAEDVVQIVHQRVWCTPSRPAEAQMLRTYVYRALGNEVIRAAKRYRAAHRYEAVNQDLEAVEEVAVPDCSDQIAERTDLYAALGALPPQQRTAVFLNKGMDVPQRETASAMGKKPGTVATHVSRAMKVLQVTLVALCVAWCGVVLKWAKALVRNFEASSGGHVPHVPTAPGTGLGVWVLGIALVILSLAALYALRRLSPLLPAIRHTLVRLANAVGRWSRRLEGIEAVQNLPLRENGSGGG